MIEGNQFVQEYIKHSVYKPYTLQQYLYGIGVFASFLQEKYQQSFSNVDFNNFYLNSENGKSYPVDKHIINEFVEYIILKFEGKAPAQKQYFSGVKSFFKVLKKNGIIRVDPTLNVKGPKYKLSYRGVSLTHHELQLMIDEARNKDMFTLRYVALVLVMAHGGLRNSEVRNLKVSKLLFDDGIIVVDEGQKTKPDTVQMSPILLDVLKQYTLHPHIVELRKANPEELVFFNNKGRRLSGGEINKILKALAIKAGISKHLTAHVLRHTCATEMYRADVQSEIIRLQMRHEHESTTRIYINPDTEEDRAILENNKGNDILKALLHKER